MGNQIVIGKSLKILHITPYYKPAWVYGGPVQSVSKLAESQSFCGHSVSVFTTTANGSTDHEATPYCGMYLEGVNVYYFKRQGFIGGFFSFQLLHKLWKGANNFDVIHIHTWWNFTSIMSVLISRIKKKQPIFSPRGMLGKYSFDSGKSRIKKIFHFVFGIKLLKSTLLHTTSRNEAVECRNLISNWNGFTLPNILSLPKIDVFSGDNCEKHRSFNIIFLSRIHPKKGLAYVFEALALLPDIPWSLQIFGDGEKSYIDELKVKASDLNISERVYWMGWANGSERYIHLGNADLMILLSENENFANVVIESLSVGTAVLISESVGLCEYVEQNQFGWITPLIVIQIKEALVRAYRDNDHRTLIRSGAPAQIRKDFEDIKISNQYIAEYQNLIAKNK